MKNKLIHILAIPTAYILWFHVMVWPRFSPWMLEYKPYVYRVLVPWMAKILTLFGISMGWAFLLLLIGTCIINILVLHRFYSTWMNYPESWTTTYVSMWGLVFLLSFDPTFYDMMTVLLMTLCFTFLSRNEYKYLIIVFPLACLNRETAFFIPLVCAAWLWKKISFRKWIFLLSYQIVVFVFIQFLIRSHFSYITNDDQYLRLTENISTWISHPQYTLLLISGFGIVLWMSLTKWKSKPDFLKYTFIVLLPLQIILYALFGAEYQLRVFSEIYPTVFMLCSITMKGIIHESKKSKKHQDSLPEMSFYRKIHSTYRERRQQGNDENLVARYKSRYS